MDEDITVYSRNLSNTMKIVSIFILFFLPPMYESSLWGMNIKPPWRDWPYIDPQKINPSDINGYINLPW